MNLSEEQKRALVQEAIDAVSTIGTPSALAVQVLHAFGVLRGQLDDAMTAIAIREATEKNLRAQLDHSRCAAEALVTSNLAQLEKLDRTMADLHDKHIEIDGLKCANTGMTAELEDVRRMLGVQQARVAEMLKIGARIDTLEIELPELRKRLHVSRERNSELRLKIREMRTPITTFLQSIGMRVGTVSGSEPTIQNIGLYKTRNTIENQGVKPPRALLMALYAATQKEDALIRPMPPKDADGLYPHQREVIEQFKRLGFESIANFECPVDTVRAYRAAHPEVFTAWKAASTRSGRWYSSGVYEQRPDRSSFEKSLLRNIAAGLGLPENFYFTSGDADPVFDSTERRYTVVPSITLGETYDTMCGPARVHAIDEAPDGITIRLHTIAEPAPKSTNNLSPLMQHVTACLKFEVGEKVRTFWGEGVVEVIDLNWPNGGITVRHAHASPKFGPGNVHKIDA